MTYHTLGKLDPDAALRQGTAVTHPEELKAAYSRISQLENILTECAAWFDQRADVVDGDYGMPSPNAEMQMMSHIDEVL
jgi:hypothetical protein